MEITKGCWNWGADVAWAPFPAITLSHITVPFFRQRQMINSFIGRNLSQYLIFLLVFYYDIWGAIMAENFKAPGALPQILPWQTASPTIQCNFQFLKIINASYGFCPAKV